jgi:hypothetical protein
MSNASRAGRFGCLLTAVTLWTVLGCGGQNPPPPVTGVLLWQDNSEVRDLEGGTVEFELNGSLAETAPLEADGTFKMDHVLPAGEYKVRVIPKPANPTQMDPRLQTFETSPLTVTGTSAPQHIVLQLSKRGR